MRPLFTLATGLALLTLIAAPASSQVVFDDFDDGDLNATFVYSETGGGISKANTDDASGTPNTALAVDIMPANTGFFTGFFVRQPRMDVSGTNAFTFQIRPEVVPDNLPLTLEVNLHEDLNGDGFYQGDVEDEIQALVEITGPGPYYDVTIPLREFTDDNSVFPGSDDGFDFTKVFEVVFAWESVTGPDYRLSVDELVFDIVPDVEIAINSTTADPMRGESVFFRGPVTNLGITPQFVYVYAEVDVPGLGTYKRNIGGKELAPGETFLYKDFPKSKNFIPLVPDAPSGTYTVTIYAASDRFGTTIYDQDSFTFDLDSVCTANVGCLTASLPTTASLETTEPTAAPNPFWNATEIRYTLAEATEVDLRVYDVTGREVAVLASGRQSAGSHAAVFSAEDLPGGVYVWRLTTNGEVATGRVTLAR
ncbi:MAG: T9SS type A sorting domain-containing protein [Bacteroidota bacterium]